MKPLRLGVLGVAYHFISRVLRPVQKSSLIELYAISSRSLEKSKNVSEKYNIPKYYGSYQDLLNDKSIEAVYIPLPNHLHLEWIKKSADAGKHIICEKPIALNTTEAKEAIDYALKKGVKIMEAFMYKFHPQWTYAKDLIKFGSFGKIQSIHTFFGYSNSDPENIRNIKSMGGGAILDIGCYAVSSSRFILGSEPKRVISLNDFDKNFGTDILSSGILDFGGVRTVFTVATQTFPWQKVEVHGSDGMFTVDMPFNPFDDYPAKITVNTSNGIREIRFDPVDHYGLEFEEFAKAIRNDTEVPNPPIDAINNIKVLDALFKSGETGNWINL